MNNKSLVLIDDPEAAEYRSALESHLPNIEFRIGRSREETFATLPIANAIITFGYHIDSKAVSLAPNLQLLQGLSSGTDHLQRAIAGRPEVYLTSMRGVHARPVAEHTLMLMLALLRGLPAMLDAQKERIWRREPGQLLAGKVVGIAGMGVIGEAIAGRCKAFEMRTIGFGTAQRECEAVDLFSTYTEMQDYLPEVDILVIVTPSNPATQGMFDRNVFGRMKKSALVVNVGRGSTVVEEDLISALVEKRIAGAGLDVFAEEPLSGSSQLWNLPNVIITPHIAGHHDGYFDSTIGVLLQNLSAFAEGAYDQMRNRVIVVAENAS